MWTYVFYRHREEETGRSSPRSNSPIHSDSLTGSISSSVDRSLRRRRHISVSGQEDCKSCKRRRAAQLRCCREEILGEFRSICAAPISAVETAEVVLAMIPMCEPIHGGDPLPCCSTPSRVRSCRRISIYRAEPGDGRGSDVSAVSESARIRSSYCFWIKLRQKHPVCVKFRY